LTGAGVYNNEFINLALEKRFYGILTMEFDEFSLESSAHRNSESFGIQLGHSRFLEQTTIFQRQEVIEQSTCSRTPL
jgi:hypothetical protein